VAQTLVLIAFDALLVGGVLLGVLRGSREQGEPATAAAPPRPPRDRFTRSRSRGPC
jgi:hypothetical protein